MQEMMATRSDILSKLAQQEGPLVGSQIGVGVADRIRAQRESRTDGSCGGVAGGWGN